MGWVGDSSWTWARPACRTSWVAGGRMPVVGGVLGLIRPSTFSLPRSPGVMGETGVSGWGLGAVWRSHLSREPLG